MGKPRWWVCSDCRSLNDLPASKCYKCRIERPARPSLIDDQYGEVGGGQARVGITVDLDRLAELTSPDPRETAKGGGVIEAFGKEGEQATGADSQPSRTSGTSQAPSQPMSPPPAPSAPPPRPLRDPTPRSIAEVGNRPWADVHPPIPTPPPPFSPPAAPPLPPQPGYAPALPPWGSPAPPGAPPAPGRLPPPGTPPPPGAAGWPPQPPSTRETGSGE